MNDFDVCHRVNAQVMWTTYRRGGCQKRRDLKLGAKFKGISGVQHNVLKVVTNFEEWVGSFGTCSSVACIAANVYHQVAMWEGSKVRADFRGVVEGHLKGN